MTFRWAHPARVQGMPTPEEMEAEGFYAVAVHPRWGSVLMRRDP